MKIEKKMTAKGNVCTDINEKFVGQWHRWAASENNRLLGSQANVENILLMNDSQADPIHFVRRVPDLEALHCWQKRFWIKKERMDFEPRTK